MGSISVDIVRILELARVTPFVAKFSGNFFSRMFDQIAQARLKGAQTHVGPVTLTPASM